MNIADTISNVTLADWLILGFLVVFFILGYAQGTIRRLLGIASILFSFLLAANLREPLGKFLAQYWTQWPPEYSYMLAFLFVFVVAGVLFAILIQSFYKQARLFTRFPVVDELLGGFLGVVEGLLIIGAFIVIFDSFFRGAATVGDNQIRLLHDLYKALDGSQTAAVFRESILPIALTIAGPILPSDIRSLYPS